MDGFQTGRVVVGVHCSFSAYQALRYATAEARTRGARLVVVHALGLAARRGVVPSDVLAREAIAEVMHAFDEALGGRPRDLTVQIIALADDPGRALVATADRETDLLVIGGSGTRRIFRRRTAIASYCAVHAVCPVTIVPVPALARTARTARLARTAGREVEEYLGVQWAQQEAHDGGHAGPPPRFPARPTDRSAREDQRKE